MPFIAIAVLFADATLEVVLVGAVAVILLVALTFTLFSRSGGGSAPNGQAPSAPRARGDGAKQPAAPVGAEQPSRAPAQPGSGAAPTPSAPASSAYPAYPVPQAPPPPASYDRPAPAAPAPPVKVAPPSTEYDGVPIPPPQPSAEGYGSSAPVTGAPAAQPAPKPDSSEDEFFAPTAGGAYNDIEILEPDEAKKLDEEETGPRRVPVTTQANRSGRGPAESDLDDADKDQRADTRTAEELAAIEPAAGGLLLGDLFNGGEQERREREPVGAASTAASLQFTSFYPREVPVQQWQTLLVYTHVADALDAVRNDALKFAQELGERPRVMHADAAQPVERGTTLTIVPSCAGVRFNPERLSLSWDEDWQRSNFRFQVAEELAGSAAAGEIAVYVGPLILAILKFGLLVSDGSTTDVGAGNTQQQTVGPSSVFASYSHDDTPVVLACRNAYRALGLTVNIDIDALRSGDQWDPRLMDLINGSDVFQLFWSAHAANSAAVEREWRYALAHRHGAGYIRPVYWEQPLIAPPPELSNVHFAYIDLPRE